MKHPEDQPNSDLPQPSADVDTKSLTIAAQPSFLNVLAVVVVAMVVLTAVMLSPAAFVTAFPPQPPKSASQVIAEKLEAQGITFDVESFGRGQSLFAVNCVACHTPEGGAKEGLGKDIVHSSFTSSQSDKELMTFMKLGRNPGDPLNTSGVGMPPKGGNPALMDDDLKDLIAYIRGLQVAEGVEFE